MGLTKYRYSQEIKTSYLLDLKIYLITLIANSEPMYPYASRNKFNMLMSKNSDKDYSV
jgi:hypothetical protein